MEETITLQNPTGLIKFLEQQGKKVRLEIKRPLNGFSDQEFDRWVFLEDKAIGFVTNYRGKIISNRISYEGIVPGSTAPKNHRGKNLQSNPAVDMVKLSYDYTTQKRMDGWETIPFP